MEILFENVKCKQCKYIIISPISLPCGSAVCQHHIAELDENVYHCQLCGQDHNVPEAGFNSNSPINLLIDLNMADYKKAYKSCEFFKSRIDELEALKNYPLSQIDTAINQLKTEIRSKSEELIKEISQKSEQVIAEMEVYQKECHILSSRLDNAFDEVASQIERDKVTLNTMLVDLRSAETASQARWDSILKDSELKAREIRVKMDSIKSFLLLNKFDYYKEKSALFCRLKFPDMIESPLKADVETQTNYDLETIDSGIGSNSSESNEIDDVDDEDGNNNEDNNTEDNNTEDNNTEDNNTEDNNTEVNHTENENKDEYSEMVPIKEENDENKYEDKEKNSYEDNEKSADKNESDNTSNIEDVSKEDESTENDAADNCADEMGANEDASENDTTDDDNKDKDEEAESYQNSDVEFKYKIPNRLSEEKVDRVFNEHDQSFHKFAARLIKCYFSVEELCDKNVSIFGAHKKKALDPIRISYIKGHIVDRNGGQALSNEQWHACMRYMSVTLTGIRHRSSKQTNASTTQTIETVKVTTKETKKIKTTKKSEAMKDADNKMSKKRTRKSDVMPKEDSQTKKSSKKRRSVTTNVLDTTASTKRILSDKEVEEILNQGDKSLTDFTARLFLSYFSQQEMIEHRVKYGRLIQDQLDPIRIAYIKKHLKSSNGRRPVSDSQWAECQVAISKADRCRRKGIELDLN